MFLLALGLAAVSLYLVTTGVGESGPDAVTQATAPAAAQVSPAEAAGKRFLDTYVKPDGRVERTDQGGDTVGEGQAYGMLIAAAIGDRKRFDLIWNWTKDNLVQPSGLIAFLWRDGEVVDPKPASDADVDAARALLAASCRFKQPDYEDEGLALGRAILRGETLKFGDLPLLIAGPWAKRPPIFVNPSYFSPATFAALGEATGDNRWASLSGGSRDVADRLMPKEGDLPPDWAQVRSGRVVATGPPGNAGDKPIFGFEAVRLLVRFAEDPDPAGRKIAARAWPAFEGRAPKDIPVEWDLSGKPAGGTEHPTALVAAAAAADAAGDTASKAELLDAAEALDRRRPTYYGSAWVALGRIMLDTNQLDCS
jgi:endo-1,4-beta-D-glucanase Y